MVRARGVVGLYGDPTVSWSIALDVAMTAGPDVGTLRARCARLVAAHPHLGLAPAPVEVGSASAEATLCDVLDTPYGDRDPLLRLAVRDDGSGLVLAAHHGAVDGLGLLAIVSLLLDEPVISTAGGIADRRSSVGFARSSASRLVEAVLRPPTRLAVDRSAPGAGDAGAGDVTARLDLTPTRANTARTLSAAARAVTEWNDRHGTRTRRLVAAVGASRRGGSDGRPDRDTAYLRLRLPADPTPDRVGRALDLSAPEPTFPERRGGGVGTLATLVTRALRGRLGSSLLVSNLGVVAAPPSVSAVAFYPSAAGPRALAVGVATTSSYTTVTVRMPRADFAVSAATELCTAIARHLGDG